MARLTISVGTRFLSQGHVYVVEELLLEDRVRIADQSFGGVEVKLLSELYEAWGRGELRFEITGPNSRKGRVSSLPVEYTFADFSILPAHQRETAWRRYEIIKPLLTLQPHERTKERLEKYASSILSSRGTGNNAPIFTFPTTSTEIAPVPPAADPVPPVSSGKVAPRAYRASEQNVSRSTIMKWLRDFRISGYDLRSLVPATHERGGKGKRRLNDEVENIITKVLAESAAHPQYRTVQGVYEDVVNKIAAENTFRSVADKLQLPSYLTIYRRIDEANDVTILRRRRSSVEAHSDLAVQPVPPVTDILERIEIDHTRLDIFIVDTVDRLPIGRPTLTLALDSFSGMPWGWYIGFEEPSYLTVMSCLEHGILPKPDVMSLYGTKNPWPVFGLPKQLIVDNGKEFVGKDLSDACAQLGITLMPLPVRAPWMKGAIERHFRTTNTSLLHTMPGTSYSNILDKGDYNAMKNACLSLDAFIQIMHIWLLDYFAQKWHDGKVGIPARLWQGRAASGTRPELAHSASDVRILLGRVEERTLQPKGIELHGLRYNSSDLTRMRTLLPKGAKARIKWDPRDIGTIHIMDTTRPGETRWEPVLCVDMDYAEGLSVWSHNKIYAYARRGKKDVNIYDLAAAKLHIQKVIKEQFHLTGKATSRRKIERVRRGMPSSGRPQPISSKPTNPSVTPAPVADAHNVHADATDSVMPHNIETNTNANMPAQDTVLTSPVPLDDSDDFDMTGYGADLGLPRHGRTGDSK